MAATITKAPNFWKLPNQYVPCMHTEVVVRAACERQQLLSQMYHSVFLRKPSLAVTTRDHGNCAEVLQLPPVDGENLASEVSKSSLVFF